MNKKLNVVLLAGGASTEREVSKMSSKAVYDVLKSKYNVTVIDPAYGKNQPSNVEDFFSEKNYSSVSEKNYLEALSTFLPDNTDVVFIGLHGKFGEDGTIQSLLELKGIKYTGSGVLASALAMDKVMTKIVFVHSGVYTPKWIAIKKNDYNPADISGRIEKEIGLPYIVKPNDQGSTIGLSICHSVTESQKAVCLAHEYSDIALIEEFIPGRELTVGIIDGKVLPACEIRPKHQHYDYECKYTHGMTDYITPADIPEEIAKMLREQTKLAYDACGCRGYGRVDFRVTDKFEVSCLEVNTLPGMTDMSLVPKMAAAAGINFNELVEKIIDLAL